MAYEDLADKRFGSLTAMEYSHTDKHGSAMWKCQCDCGSELIARAGALKSGNTKSCGCQTRTRKHGLWKHPLYNVWQSMKTRCYNPKANRYQYYGGRGITVCEDWLDFTTFYNWAMSNGYHQGLTLDRVDRDKGYSPENCRWVDVIKQNNNKGDNVRISFDGREYTVKQFAKLTGITESTLYQRLRKQAK
jgi:hypothetical protein